MFFANLIQTSIDWFTLWAMGSIGGNALAVFGLGRTVVTWAGAVLWALAVGTMVLVARAVGAGDHERVARTVVQALVFTISITTIMALLFMLIASPLLSLISSDVALVSEGTGFLRAYLISMITMVMIYLVLSILRGAGESALAMRLQILTNCLQGFLIWGFAFGVGPFPRLGVYGVAAGIAISRIVGVSSTIAVFLSGRSRVRVRLEDFLRYRPDREILGSIIRVSLPNGGESLARSSSRMVIMRIISSTAARSNAVAAYTVGSQIESLYDMIGSSFGTAAATSVGQNLGALRPEAARSECHRSARYGLAISICMGALIAVFAPGIMGFFTTSAETIRTGGMLLRLLGLSAPFYIGMVTYFGGLKGAGDTRTPMVISILGSWLIQIPFAYASVRALGLDTTGVWASEALNYTVQGIIAYLLFRKGTWMQVRI